VAPTQRIYRILLTAMSHPGRAYALPTGEDWPTGLLAIAQTLFDHEVGFTVIGEQDAQAAAAEIYAITKARAVEVAEADFIIILGGDSGGTIEQAKRGHPAYPDQNATLIYIVEALDPRNAPIVRLSGPGIAGKTEPVVRGLTRGEYERLRALNQEYPLGLDCFVLDGQDRVMCIPRSTHIMIG